MADLFCRGARIRIYQYFCGVCWNNDLKEKAAADKAMEGGYEWLEKGIVVDDGMGFNGTKTKKKN
jgi:hypothetical protein